jgi:hypothetical protein
MAGNTGGVVLNVTIEDHTSGGVAFETQQLSENDVRIIARDEIAQRSDGIVARALSDPNSKTSKSLSRHTGTRRSYA